ncbi:MAG: DUF1007 family protein [Thermodesulfobacteriota bacterium]|nr:DUF1007 family protein [Thermodesulfobacteriota bacterium]
MDKSLFPINITRTSYWVLFCCAVLVFDLIRLPGTHAHPHVFIVQRLNVVFDEKGLAGIKVCWKFDDMFAGMITEDYDLNRNGKFEANEVQEIKEKAFSFTSEYSYFTFIKIDNVPFQVKFVRDFNAILESQKLVYEFLIPCHVIATVQVKKVTVASYDPSYYTAIFFTQKEPVTLTNADDFDVKMSLKEDPDTKIYFDMIHPWTLFMEFRQKS